ncbi:hypothetical protein EJB05_57856, partial [Eragrostis curvula]
MTGECRRRRGGPGWGAGDGEGAARRRRAGAGMGRWAQRRREAGLAGEGGAWRRRAGGDGEASAARRWRQAGLAGEGGGRGVGERAGMERRARRRREAGRWERRRRGAEDGDGGACAWRKKLAQSADRREQRSTAAAQVSDTLRRCQAPPLAGEVKSCTTSLEATVRSAVDDMLGGAGAGDGVVRAAVTPVHGDLYVAFHKMPFPYAVYQCHMTKLGYEAHVVSLRGIHGGAAADMLAYCHMDTSTWNPAHPAFEVLHTSPGGSPVCPLHAVRRSGVRQEDEQSLILRPMRLQSTARMVSFLAFQLWISAIRQRKCRYDQINQ